jgi:WD40 repeat protein
MFPPLLPKTKWIVVWDIEREKILSDWKQMLVKYENCSAAFTPDEKFLFLGSMDGIMRKWSIEDRKNIDEWKLFSSTISTISFSPEGRLLAIKGSDYLKAGGPGVKIWNLTTNEEIRVFRDVGGVRGACDPYPMAFSNNGTSFVLKHSKTLCLYETSQWKAQWCVDL